jgi:hypothetical protein
LLKGFLGYSKVFVKRSGFWILACTDERIPLYCTSDSFSYGQLCSAEEAAGIQGDEGFAWHPGGGDRYYFSARLVEGLPCIGAPNYDVALGADGELHVFNRFSVGIPIPGSPGPQRVELKKSKALADQVIHRMALHLREVQPALCSEITQAQAEHQRARKRNMIRAVAYPSTVLVLALGIALIVTAVGVIPGVIIAAVAALALAGILAVELWLKIRAHNERHIPPVRPPFGIGPGGGRMDDHPHPHLRPGAACSLPVPHSHRIFDASSGVVAGGSSRVSVRPIAGYGRATSSMSAPTSPGPLVIPGDDLRDPRALQLGGLHYPPSPETNTPRRFSTFNAPNNIPRSAP